VARTSGGSTSSRRRLRDRVLGVVLRAYPAPFRAHYAHEILTTLRDQRRALGSLRLWATAAFWARAFIDLLRAAATERIADARDRASITRGRIARRSLGVLLVAFAIGNVVYDVAEPKLRMGVLAMLLTGLSGLAGLRLLWRGPPAI
jgi:hypothetical protein